VSMSMLHKMDAYKKPMARDRKTLHRSQNTRLSSNQATGDSEV